MSKIALKQKNKNDKLVEINPIVSRVNPSLKLKRLTIEEVTNITAARNKDVIIINKKTSSIFLRRDCVFFTIELGMKRSMVSIF